MSEPTTEPVNQPQPQTAAAPVPPASGATGVNATAAAVATRPTEPAPPARRKRRGLRIFAWSAVVVLLLLIVGGGVLYVYRNTLVERAIEEQATKSTNLKTELDGVNLSLFGSQLDLDGLKIASPQGKGFTAPYMLTLGGADVDVSYGQLRQDPVRIGSITLDKPKLVIERADTGGALNFKVAADLMPKTDTQPDPQAEPTRLVIDTLTIQEANVVVRPGIPGLAEEITVPIPTVTMKNIGSGEGAQNGAAMKDVVMQVITVLAARASESDQLPQQLQNLMKVNVGQTVAYLGQEAQKRIVESIPGPLGGALANLINDPQALLKDPSAIEQRMQQEVGKLIGGALPPGTEPGSDGQKLIQEGLKGILGGDKDEKKDRERKERKRERERERKAKEQEPGAPPDPAR